VLFDEITSVYFIRKIYILALEMASPGNRHCAICIGALSFPIFWSALQLNRLMTCGAVLQKCAIGDRSASWFVLLPFFSE